MENSTSEKIEIYLSCRNLKDLDVFSKSDPYVKVSYRKDFTQKQYAVLGKTETIQNNLNPNYAKTFCMDYIFQSRQDIRFDLYDDDNQGDSDDYIGTVETTIGALMGARGQTSILDLKNPAKPTEITGKLIVRCEKLKDTNEYFNMKFRAEKLLNVDSFFDFWDKSDPYLKFNKIRDDNSFIEVQRSQIIKDNLNPSWKQIQIQSSRLINPNKQTFKIQVWDWEEDGKDQFIGEIFVTPNQMVAGARFELTNPKSKKAGALILETFQLAQRPTFVDYLRGGLQLNMIVAIDFTGSNGSPKQPSSLHFMNPAAPNQYQQAIQSISGILMNYDSDKRIPAFGFGAKPLYPNFKMNTVCHCFPLSGSPEELEAFGVEHLMNLYKVALTNVQLSGPTYFGPLVEETSKLAYVCKQGGSDTYQTLLILTDGQIHDMDKTIDQIVQAANLPLSIIIVGVGNADFTNMNRLDGDNGLFSMNGVKSARDIVQFVPFRDVQMSGDLLAKELLSELPGQVVQYMSMIGKPPGKYVPPNLEAMINQPKPQ